MMEMRTGTHEIAIETVELSGRLDALEATGLRDLLTARIDAGSTNLALDLSNVSFVDSAGLAALVKGMKGARSAGGDLRIVSPTNADAMRVFELTQFDKVFQMAPTLDELLSQW